jgi:hypothetical protein
MPVPLARQRLEGTTVGFVIGALAGFALWFAFLLIDVANPHFEDMYEGPRPHGLLALLHFMKVWEILYLLTGLIGAVIGFFTSGRRRISRLLALPGLALMGSFLLGSAWVNLYNIDEQPYWLLVSIALAGVLCLVSAVWIGCQARPSRLARIEGEGRRD